MSVASEITRINTNIANAYTACNNKGGTLPQIQNSANLSTTINSIPSGGEVPEYFVSTLSGTSGNGNGISNSILTIPDNIVVQEGSTTLSKLFAYCGSLTKIPSLNTSSVTDMSDMFYYCSSLTEVPSLDTSSVTSMSYMFSGCSALTEIPQLNTSNVTNMNSMFSGCGSLTTIPQLNTSSVTTCKNMFQNCSSLTDNSLNNILAMCIGATSYTGTKTLTFLGLTTSQRNKCANLSNYSDFIAAGWTK